MSCSEGKLDKIITGGLVGHIFLAAGGMDLGKKNLDVLKKEVTGFEKNLSIPVISFSISLPAMFGIASLNPTRVTLLL